MRKTRKLNVEGLENRALLAGDVAVSVSGGTLFITGDGFGNGVAVQQLDSGKYFVSGFALNGSNTTVNGQATGTIVSGVVNDINADLNGGNDIFVMSNSAFRRQQLADQLSGGTAGPVQTSPQAPVSTIDGVTTRVPRNLLVTTEGGNDGVGFGARIGSDDLKGSDYGGVGHIVTGDGADRVIAERSIAFDDLLIETGAGNDGVSTSGTNTYDFLFADLGTGNDAFTSSNNHGFHSQIYGRDGNDRISVSNFRFEEEIFLNGGNGANSISANGMSAGHISLIGGTGHDVINVQGSASSANYVVDTGAGDDSVTLNNTWVHDRLTVNMGDTNDDLHIGNTTTGEATLNGGAGDDSYFDDGGNSFGSLSKSGFEHNA